MNDSRMSLSPGFSERCDQPPAALRYFATANGEKIARITNDQTKLIGPVY